jgi:integrase
VAPERADRDPAQDLKDALRKPEVRHFAAITDPSRMGALLRACDGYADTLLVRAALRLAPKLLLRPGELRHAQWPEIHLDTVTWTVPAQRMKRWKSSKEHGPAYIVPLPRQAVETLTGIQPISGGGQ